MLPWKITSNDGVLTPMHATAFCGHTEETMNTHIIILFSHTHAHTHTEACTGMTERVVVPLEFPPRPAAPRRHGSTFSKAKVTAARIHQEVTR